MAGEAHCFWGQTTAKDKARVAGGQKRGSASLEAASLMILPLRKKGGQNDGLG